MNKIAPIRFVFALILTISVTLPASTYASGDPWLGVSVDALSFDELQRLDLDYGLRIEEVSADSPAAKAGLREGDLLLELGGRPLYSVGRLQWLVHRHQPGDSLAIFYRRDGETRRGEVTLGSWQARRHDHSHPYYGAKRSYLGLRLQAMSDQLRQHFGAPADSGMLVSEVVAGSPAAKGGIKVGDIIVRMDRKTIHDMGDIRRVLDFFEPGDSLEVAIIRNAQQQTLTITLGAPQRTTPPAPFMPYGEEGGWPHTFPPYHPPGPPPATIPKGV